MNAVRNTELSLDDGTRATNLVPAVSTAYRILEALAERRPHGATLTELVRALALSKSTMHGQLATLNEHGLIQRDDVTRRFRLGPTLVALGEAAALDPDMETLAAEWLPALAGEHHLTFALATVIDRGEAVLTHRAYPLRSVHVGLALGNTYSMFDGAIGKCLLAALTQDAAAEAARARSIPLHTERTIVDPAELLAEVSRVRKRGWASSAGELKENHAVAAPLLAPDGTLAFVLCAVGFPGDIPEQSFETLGGVLRETTRMIEIASSSRPGVTDDEACAASRRPRGASVGTAGQAPRRRGTGTFSKEVM